MGNFQMRFWKCSAGLTAQTLQGCKLCCRTWLFVIHFRLGSKDFFYSTNN